MTASLPEQAAHHRHSQWRHAEPEQRVALIVDVALGLLAQHGPAAVTMRRVADGLGVGTMTLYSYIAGQDELRTRMIRRGFNMLSSQCEQVTVLERPSNRKDWRAGARAYVHFALENPNLYRLMFSDPTLAGDAATVMAGEEGFGSLVSKVAEQLQRETPGKDGVERQARVAAGRYWIALHGLASLAIDDRLGVLGDDVDTLLEHMLACVAPT